MLFSDIFKNSNYGNSLFHTDEINAIEHRVTIRTATAKAKETAYINCLIRNKQIKLTPEEAVRQLYIYRLLNSYGYSADRLRLEFPVNFGREIKRADIVIMDKLNPTAAYIIVEVKKPKLKDGKEQLKSYTNATGAPIAVWTNGEQVSCYNRKDPNYFEQLSDIPKATEKLSDILNERINYEELKRRDKIANEKRSLRDLVIEIEDEVLANAGVDSFEEVFKLIFSKLYDELVAANDPNYYLQFRNGGDTDSELKAKIEELFNSAKRKWNGIFPDGDTILLTPSHLAVCVSTLQDVKLFNNNLDVIDDAFEYLMSKSQKGEKGQYFTPRYVIDMCVKMMNPQERENIIDTAAGSSGFPVHSIFHVWKNIRNELNLPVGEGFVTDRRTEREIAFVRDHVFAIDFDEKTVRVARTLNLIAGDGQSNVIHLNTLDYGRWREVTSGRVWRRNYNAGFERLLDIRPEKASDDDYSQFSFDLLMANPPFAGDIKEGTILARYELGKNDKDKQQNKVGRDILFIERNLSFLKPGGRMAIVLPQGRFNNSSDKRIRDYIAQRCRILAVVGLHGNVFKPHTGTKTSVLFVQKWDDVLCPRQEDYPIFFATMLKPSKDNSGDKIYVKDAGGEPLLDSHGHLIVDHDLYNHDDITADGIAEAFIEFAKRERLSFFVHARPFDAERYTALMGGLEAVEVLFQETLKASAYFRLEAEYFNAKTGTGALVGEDVCSLINYGTSCSLNEEKEGYPTLRLNEIVNMFIQEPAKSCNSLSQSEFDLLRLMKNDIVVCRTNGNPNLVGKCAVVMADTEYAFASYCFRIRTNDKIQPCVLVSYLSGKYGRMEIDKYSIKGNQTNFSPAKFKNISIPLFGNRIQTNITSLFEIAHGFKENANTLYIAAESHLLSALGMDNYNPSQDPIAVKPFSESFGVSGRLDAEYYQQKYEDVLHKISNFKCKRLGDIVSIKKSIEPGRNYYSNEGVPFVRVSDISKFGIKQPEIMIPGNMTELRPLKDTILLSKDGSVGIAYKAEADLDYITSSALLHLTVTEDVLPDYLTIVLNSIIVQLQAERDAGGSIIQHWKPSEIEEIVVPILDDIIQQQIAADVQQSFAFRRQSEQLLEAAKQAVEIAIEVNEDAAMAWLENATSNNADIHIQGAEMALEKADSKMVPTKTDDYYNQRFNLWMQSQGLAARGDIDRQTLREIFDAMDDDDK